MPYGAHFFRAKSAHGRHDAHIDTFAIGSKNFRKNWYPGVFWVAEYEFGGRIRKFKIADIIRWTGI